MSKAASDLAATASATARDRLLIAARRGGRMDQPGDQLTALLELARALDEAAIPYALIGGIAVAVHAETPRATVDIHVAVPTSMPRTAVEETLVAQGFTPTGTFEHSINFRHVTGEPVQIAFDRAFDPFVDRSETIDVAGRAIRVVRKDDLIAMKERAARDPARRRSKALRDLADIEMLKGDTAGPDEGW